MNDKVEISTKKQNLLIKIKNKDDINYNDIFDYIYTFNEIQNEDCNKIVIEYLQDKINKIDVVFPLSKENSTINNLYLDIIPNLPKDYFKKFKHYILSSYKSLPQKHYQQFVQDNVLNIDDKDIVLHYHTFLLINNISLDEFERVALANNLKKEDIYYHFLNNNNDNNDVIINYSRISEDVFLDLCLFIKDEDDINKLTKVFDFYTRNSYIKYLYEIHYDKINYDVLYPMINQYESVATLTDLCLIRNKLKNNYVNETITNVVNRVDADITKLIKRVDSNNSGLFVIKKLEQNLVLKEQELLNNVVKNNNIKAVKKL